MLKLDKRLKEIINCIPPSSRIIDIGCDHGKIPVEAVLKGIAKSAIATDISVDSLNKTRKLVDEYGLNDKIELRVGDGLDIISEDQGETLIIAGMGAREIIAILSRARLNFSTYIFTPHQETIKLREYLINNNYIVNCDKKVKAQSRFYDIIVCNKGNCSLSYRELMLGKSDNNNADFMEFLKFEAERVENLLMKIPKEVNTFNELKRYAALVSEVINGKC